MRPGHAIGLGLILLGAATGVADLLALLTLEQPEHLSLATIWSRVHGSSFEGLRAMVESWLGASTWTLLHWALSVPAWIILAVAGVILMLRNRRRRGFLD
jgi:hypothetical protein